MSFDDDTWLALELLHGRIVNTATNAVEYLKKGDKAEKEAKAALARVLLACSEELKDVTARVLMRQLAYLFNPAADNSPTKRFWNNRTVDFRNISTKSTTRHTAWRDFAIALDVHLRCQGGQTNEKAIEEVAEKFSMTVRHLKRIIKKSDVKKMLEPYVNPHVT